MQTRLCFGYLSSAKNEGGGQRVARAQEKMKLILDKLKNVDSEFPASTSRRRAR